jgi:hypothetical protein
MPVHFSKSANEQLKRKLREMHYAGSMARCLFPEA